jgi:hypothetical protein
MIDHARDNHVARLRAMPRKSPLAPAVADEVPRERGTHIRAKVKTPGRMNESAISALRRPLPHLLLRQAKAVSQPESC